LYSYAVSKFADALECVPRTLAENAGFDAMQTLAQLYAAHERGSTISGIDIESTAVGGGVSETLNVHDLLSVKLSAFRLTMDAVTTILRVDQIIQAKPAGGPKLGQKQGHWDVSFTCVLLTYVLSKSFRTMNKDTGIQIKKKIDKKEKSCYYLKDQKKKKNIANICRVTNQ